MPEIILSKPISAHGKTVSVLELREPTIQDVRKHGFPYRVHTDGGIEIVAESVLGYLGTLAFLPSSSVDQIALADLSQIQGVIMGFFGDATGAESPTGLSTSPSSGE
jgi:hypothetical protein